MLTDVISWLNALANAVVAPLLAPIGMLPGWLSATLVAVVTGVLMLLVFKYTSNQSAIGRTRNEIRANLLALSLFKDNISVSLRAQGRILRAAGRLALYAIVPMLVMIVPMCLLLGQLALWYQARPLKVGEDAVISVRIAGGPHDELPAIELADSSAVRAIIGPVRVPAKRLICWDVEACQPGYHRLAFVSNGKTYEKEVAIGDGFMRASLERPARDWSSMLLHPREEPFGADSQVQSIDIAYPERASWTSGRNSWLVYWFVVSMIAAFVAKPLVNVNI